MRLKSPRVVANQYSARTGASGSPVGEAGGQPVDGQLELGAALHRVVLARGPCRSWPCRSCSRRRGGCRRRRGRRGRPGPRTRSVAAVGQAEGTTPGSRPSNPKASSAATGRVPMAARLSESCWRKRSRSARMRRRSRRQKIGRPVSPAASACVAARRRRSPAAARGRRASRVACGPGCASAGRSRTSRKKSSRISWTRLPLSRAVIGSSSSGFSTGRRPQDVVHEVGVRAAGPALEAGGRGGRVDGRGHRQAGQVAVEAGEGVGCAGRR